MIRLICTTFLGAVTLSFTAMTDLPTANAAGFYEGKTLKVIIRSGPGGGYDYYGRLISRHMPRHIPGNPTATPVNMPGAGGIVATNYLMNRAKKNGTEIAILNRELAIAQRTNSTGVNYDVRQLIAIGSAASSTSVTVLAGNHPVKSIEQLKTFGQTVKMSVTGPGSGSYQRVAMLKFDGFPVEMITGYTSSQERFLAIARGEVQGTVNSYESTFKAIKEYGLTAIGYLGNARPELKGVPNLRSAMSEKGRQLASLMAAPMAAGRPFFTTPKVPADRVKILRAAFKAALSDPKLLAEARKAKRSVDWTDPLEIESINRDILNATDDVIKTFKNM
jgi:tripartite-type tricarboxylate transporter receptor subunit TctC